MKSVWLKLLMLTRRLMEIYKIQELSYTEKNYYKNLMSYRNLIYTQEFSKSKNYTQYKRNRKAYKEIIYSQRKENT